MSARAPRTRRLFCLALLLLVAWPSLAFAWVETVVRSHQARVIVERNGQAEVRHELLVKLRGGPLESIDVVGLGAEIQALPDATVNRADQGSGPVSPIQLTPTGDGGLRLEVLGDRGLRGGSYLFRFGYKLSLREAGWLESQGDQLRLRFVGPRLPTGVDAARVTFVVPRAEVPPRLPEQMTGPSAGIMLNQVRRGADSDEIDLVRAHLAVGEPALWEIVIDKHSIGLAAEQLIPAGAGPVPVVERALRSRGVSPWVILGALASGLFYGSLAWWKGRLAEQAARLSSARVRALLPGSFRVRAAISGVCTAAGVWLVHEQQATAAAVVACGALLATSYLLPVRAVSPRGPGVWKKLDPAQVPSAQVLPGRVFEPGSLLGFTTFCCVWLAMFAGAYRLLAVSTYAALMVALGALLFVPLFWTGRHGDLPDSPWVQGRRWFGFLSKQLEPSLGQVELWGRCPDTSSAAQAGALQAAGDHYAPDEVRVRIVLAAPRPGLRALEVALEEGAGSFVMPCAVLRVLEDSEAATSLPGDLPWVRGRSAEEKVALVRPAVPTPKSLLRLVRSLGRCLTRASAEGTDVGPKRSARAASTVHGSAPALSTL